MLLVTIIRAFPSVTTTNPGDFGFLLYLKTKHLCQQEIVTVRAKPKQLDPMIALEVTDIWFQNNYSTLTLWPQIIKRVQLSVIVLTQSSDIHIHCMLCVHNTLILSQIIGAICLMGAF